MAVSVRAIYCIDTGSLVYVQRSFGRQPSHVSFYASVWTLLNRLADEGRLRAPHQVFVEITKNDDQIGRWANAHLSIFRPKGEHAARVIEILKIPGQRLVSATAPRGSEEADPWVIALAQAISEAPPQLLEREAAVVVTEETKAGGISEICNTLGIQCIDVVGMLGAEGLTVGFQTPLPQPVPPAT